MDGTIITSLVSGGGGADPRRLVIFRHVGRIFLRPCGQVNDGGCDRIGPSESNDDARTEGMVVECNEAAGVAQ